MSRDGCSGLGEGQTKENYPLESKRGLEASCFVVQFSEWNYALS